jgi:cation diffusion facilitator CzcD-associated flavoprotein CzcO
VIGTGPAAAQFVPVIQPRVKRLVVFQRTPPWVVSHTDRSVSAIERRLYKLLPPAQDIQRNLIFALHEAVGLGFRGRTELIGPIEALGRAHLRRQVKDPRLRAKLTPHYRFGCKRPVLSNTYYPALTRPNVELETGGIERLEGNAVITSEGRRHELDTIITAIGYLYTDRCWSSGCAALAGARSATSGSTRPGPISARRSRASPTCSSCWVRTRSGSAR